MTIVDSAESTASVVKKMVDGTNPILSPNESEKGGTRQHHDVAPAGEVEAMERLETWGEPGQFEMSTIGVPTPPFSFCRCRILVRLRCGQGRRKTLGSPVIPVLRHRLGGEIQEAGDAVSGAAGRSRGARGFGRLDLQLAMTRSEKPRADSGFSSLTLPAASRNL